MLIQQRLLINHLFYQQCQITHCLSLLCQILIEFSKYGFILFVFEEGLQNSLFKKKSVSLKAYINHYPKI